MSNVSPIKSQISERELDPGLKAQVAALAALVKTLGPEAQRLLMSELNLSARPTGALRGGDVLNAVVRFLPRRATWTVEDVKSEVDSAGVSASPKEVYNALGYLQRRGQIRRVGYGRYVVCGALMELPEDFGGPPICRATEHD